MAKVTHLLEVLVTGNTRGAIASMREYETQAARSFGAANTGAQKFEASLIRGGAVAVGFAAVAGAGLLNAGQAAATLEQRVDATGKIFKEARGPIDDFSKSAAQAAGLSEAEARAATARIGSLLQNAGFSAEEATGKTIQLVQRAADLALTFGKPVEEATNAIAATLRGERDPIEQFGVTLKEADVAARVAALGLNTGTAAATAHAKAVATLSLVLEQTNYAEGQFAAQSDTAAGKMAILRAEAQNLKAEIGQGALPVITTLAGGLSAAAAGFNALGEDTKTAVGSVAALSTVAIGTVGAIALVGGAASKAVGHLKNMSAASFVAAGAFTGIVVAFSAAAFQMQKQAADAKLEIDLLTQAMVDFGKTGVPSGEIERGFGKNFENLDAMLNELDEIKRGGLLGELDAAGEALLQSGNKFTGAGTKQALSDFDEALVGVAKTDLPLAIKNFYALADAYEATGRTFDQVVRDMPGFIAYLHQAASSAVAAANSTDMWARAIENVRSAVKDERSRIDAEQGTQRVISATQRLNDLRAEAAKAGQADSDAARKIRDANQRVVDSLRDRADAVKDLLEAQQDLATFNSAEEGKIRGLEREQILRRRIGNAEEARQKEIDLYRFDQRVAEEGERLNEGVVSAERDVEDATRKVGDAHEDVADAARDRAEKEKNYAAEIAKAQLDIDAAALTVLETYIKTADELGANTTQAKLLREELEKIAPLVGPDTVIGKLISGTLTGAQGSTGFTGALSVLNAGVSGPVVGGAKVLQDAQKAGTLNVDALKWVQAGGGPISLDTLLSILGGTFIGPISQPTKDFLHTLGIPGYQSGGIVAGPVGRPQLAVVHGGEEITPPGTGRTSSNHLSIVQNNQFVGGDVPTVTQLDAQNRKLGIRVALSGRRG